MDNIQKQSYNHKYKIIPNLEKQSYNHKYNTMSNQRKQSYKHNHKLLTLHKLIINHCLKLLMYNIMNTLFNLNQLLGYNQHHRQPIPPQLLELVIPMYKMLTRNIPQQPILILILKFEKEVPFQTMMSQS